MSFIHEMKKNAEIAKSSKEKKAPVTALRRVINDDNKDMKHLCEIYEPKIIGRIEYAAKTGKTNAVMNLERSDFGPIHGRNAAVKCREMFAILTSTGRKLEGLKYDVWNNSSFTVYLNWE